MYKYIATYKEDLSAIGFGDELQFDYDPSDGCLRVSVFKDNHWQDEAVIRLPELFIEEDSRSGVPANKPQYPAANSISVGSIVMTKNCLDVGIVGAVSNGRPTKVYARYNPYSANESGFPQYGGADTTDWYDTGYKMTMEQWKLLAIEKKDAMGFYQYWRDRLL